MARPHAVVVPYPYSGNVNPALQLAKLLHHHGIYITFVNTEHNHCRVQDTEGAGAVRGRDGFRFEAIPDGLTEADRSKQDYGQSLLVSTSQCCAAPLKDLILRLNGTPGVPPVTCVLPTGLMSFALGVARELGIPTMVFWCAGAAALMAHMMIPELIRRGYVPLKDSSHTLVSPDQLDELAWGLVGSGHKFLWSVRDDTVLETLPPAFAAETAAGRGLLTTWCPQEEVLIHPAVGCFLTHNGWNSTSESLTAGVPMVCWPGFADQFTNCKYVCEVWGVGVRLDAEIKREQVAKHVKEAMASKEIRASAARWSEAAEAAASLGGSSYKSLLSMVRALGSPPRPSTES